MDRSTVPLDALLCIGGAIYEESLKYGDLNEGKLFHGLQDFLNKSRMGSNHFDRDRLSHDLYYSTLYMVEVSALILSFNIMILHNFQESLPCYAYQRKTDIRIWFQILIHLVCRILYQRTRNEF